MLLLRLLGLMRMVGRELGPFVHDLHQEVLSKLRMRPLQLLLLRRRPGVYFQFLTLVIPSSRVPVYLLPLPRTRLHNPLQLLSILLPLLFLLLRLGSRQVARKCSGQRWRSSPLISTSATGVASVQAVRGMPPNPRTKNRAPMRRLFRLQLPDPDLTPFQLDGPQLVALRARSRAKVQHSAVGEGLCLSLLMPLHCQRSRIRI